MRHASENNVGYLLARAAHVWNKTLIEELATRGYHDQKPSFGAVLIPLFDAECGSISEIRAFSGLTKQTMSSYIRELTKLGYIRTRTDPIDRRRTVLCLTPQGKRLKQAADESAAEVNRSLKRTIGKRAYSELVKTLARAIHPDTEE